MTETASGASFVGQDLKNTFVTLAVAVALTNQPSGRIERLCIDGRITCAGGKSGELFLNLHELLKILGIALGEDVSIPFVAVEAIAIPRLSKAQLIALGLGDPSAVVGNHPVDMVAGAVSEPAPLKRGPLPFSIISEDEAARVDETTPVARGDVVDAIIEMPPPPPSTRKSLPEHWPIKTSLDSAKHFDDAPLLPPLSEKSVAADSGKVTLDVPKNMQVEPQKDLLPEVRGAMAIEEAPGDAIETQKELAVDVPTESAIAMQTPTAVEEEPERAVGIHEVQAVEVAEQHEVMESEERPLLEQGEMNPYYENDQQGDTTTNEDDVAAPQPVIAKDDEVSSSEQEIPDDVQDEAVESNEAVEELPPQGARPEVVIDKTPPSIDREVSDRILQEGLESAPTPVVETEVGEESEDVSEPIVAVPHFTVQQMTPSMHPLALPPKVVPFATVAPGAYPKVAAVFTQPHARAAEWLPWMRTSHFSKVAVQNATHPEVRPSFPRYSVAADIEESVETKENATPVAAIADKTPGIPARAPTSAEMKESAAPQKVFVSVVGKPTPPVVIPVEPHVEHPANDIRALPPNMPMPEDAWDEMLAPLTMRTSAVDNATEDSQEKSREELLEEVSNDIKDSWDASFLTGLDAA